MRIGIDIDEVVAEWLDKMIELVNKEKNANYKKLDMTTADIGDVMGLTQEDINFFFEKFCTQRLLEDLPPIEGSKDVINRWFDKNHKIFFVTSRKKCYKSAEEQTLNWLKKHGFKFHKIIFNHDKHDAAEKLNVNFFIEDDFRYAKHIADKGIKVFLLDKPYNQDAEHENITRVKNWKEIEEISKQLFDQSVLI